MDHAPQLVTARHKVMVWVRQHGTQRSQWEMQWWTQQSALRTITDVTRIVVRVQGQRQTVRGPCSMQCKSIQHEGEQTMCVSNK